MTQADGLDDPIEAGVTVGGVAAAVAAAKFRGHGDDGAAAERDTDALPPGVVEWEDLPAAERERLGELINAGAPARQETTLPRGVPLLDGESADAYWDRTAPTESPKDRDPADWKSGDEPMSDRQRWALERKGIDVGAGMSKAQASLLISGDAAGAAAVAARPARSADVKNNGRRDGGVVRSESAADGPASVSQSALAAEKARAKFKGRGR